ncbi:MAG: PhzF family phenazine biosynthesis protein [Actinobacteria bacterium]|nr:PhzF family phenazine biosynthesis protein [Actinomycetota bacterium]
MTPIIVYIVDAFSDRPFSGNPAGVCILAKAATERWMQALAGEINLSETAFLVPTAQTQKTFSLRWFTPAAEVELCGHATLASAHILWETGMLGPTEVARFQTLSGLLTASRTGDWIEMDFPATPPQQTPAPSGLSEALGLADDPSFVGLTRFDFFLEVAGESTVRRLSPKFDQLRRLGARGFIVTSRADPDRGPGGVPGKGSSGQTQDYDFVSRFFAPGVGVNEDPVTGSAHCALAPYWSHKLGKAELVAFQASARGGVVRVTPADDRVLIAGQAVTTMRDELMGIATETEF